MALKLSGDFETASIGSLPQMGAHKYARQPSTRILCFAYAIDEDDPYVWFPERQPVPKNLLKAVRDPAVEFHAWNAQFEFNIWNECGRSWGLPQLPIERFHCSMARALYWGVPPKLEQAAVVVGANVHKDKVGATLMRQMTKPRAATHEEFRLARAALISAGITDDPKTLQRMVREMFDDRWWDRDELDRLIRLGEYCAQDVRTERAVARRLKPLPAIERQLWLLDQRMNGRGLKVDISAVRAMQHIVDGELKRLGLALSRLTDGEIKSPTQTAAIVEYLRGQGVKIDSLDKKVLPLVLKEPLIPRHRKILSLYQEGAKTSTAKLRSMINYLDRDSRARCLVQYGGAMRTLRWAGRGPQIQNYPRPVKEINAKAALVDILNGADADTVDFVHGPPMTVVSQCLRGAYVAAPGRLLAVCDYSAIEARVVAWLAGQDDILDVFRRGQDIYVKAARDVGSSSRMLGKVLVLACGFGMGPVRFRVTAATHGVVLTEDEAKQAVWGWRDNNSSTRALWYNVDAIIRKVIKEKVVDRWTWTDSKKLAFRMARDDKLAGALLMKMPSGRPIVYRNARIDKIITDEDGAGDVEEVIRYDGHDYQKKWARIRTWGGKVVENATQATARDLLADAMLTLDNDEDDLDVTIHDELVAEPLIERADARLKEMMAVMSTAPDWAQGLPLAAAGGVMPRYGKE